MQVLTQARYQKGGSRMKNNTRNERINQVNEHTLVIGIDIAKSTHYACAIDDRGREWGKPWKVPQSKEGFWAFAQVVREHMEAAGKTNVFVGFEATGHYWMNLAAFLDLLDWPYVLVNPMHVKRSKELDDNMPTKSDAKDARVIAKLLPSGNYWIPRKRSEIDHVMRRGAAVRERLRKDMAAIKNRMWRWTDLYFPEFPQVFRSFGIQAQEILMQTPFPEDMIDVFLEDLLDAQKKAGAIYASRPKMKMLQEQAPQSIGLAGNGMARIEIQQLVEQLRLLEKQHNLVVNELVEQASGLPEFAYLVSIPGISETLASELLAEVGSFSDYHSPRQLIKLAGLTLRENSSGQSQGQKKISKRGRRRLRTLLYKATLPLIQNNEAFRALYTHYHARPINPLTKKEALVVLCKKLLQVAHGLTRHQVFFDTQQMIRDTEPIRGTASGKLPA